MAQLWGNCGDVLMKQLAFPHRRAIVALLQLEARRLRVRESLQPAKIKKPAQR